jgi:hypothetical protein
MDNRLGALNDNNGEIARGMPKISWPITTDITQQQGNAKIIQLRGKNLKAIQHNPTLIEKYAEPNISEPKTRVLSHDSNACGNSENQNKPTIKPAVILVNNPKWRTIYSSGHKAKKAK